MRRPVLAINVAGLLGSTPGTTRRYPVSNVRLDLGDDLQVEPIAGSVRLTRTNRGLLVDGRLATALVERCGRCLTPVRAAVEVDLSEEALPTIELDTGRPVDLANDSDVLHIDEHHVLDLEPAVRDAINLAEPMRVLCRETCAGLCPDCGRDLNLEPHEHEPKPDPRLAPLAKLLGNERE
jgi:uncharacterized protein